MKVNGEAIYGTRPIAPYKEGQVVFTQKGKWVYAIYLTRREGDSLPSTIRFQSLRPKAGAKVRMLGVNTPLNWQTSPAGETVIEIPAAVVSAPPCQHAFVIRFEPELTK